MTKNKSNIVAPAIVFVVFVGFMIFMLIYRHRADVEAEAKKAAEMEKFTAWQDSVAKHHEDVEKKLSDFEFYKLKARQAENQRDYAHAQGLYESVLKTKHKDAVNTVVDAYIRIGDTYRDKNNKSKASAYYNQAIALEGKGGLACGRLRDLTAKQGIVSYYTVSICCDGSFSASTGQGACSHHKGVCRTERRPMRGKVYTMKCN